MTIIDTVIQYASRPEGLSTWGDEPLRGITGRQATNLVPKLIVKGKLIAVGKSATRRLFVSQEHADAYAKELPAILAALDKVRRSHRAEGIAYREAQRKAKELSMPQKPVPSLNRQYGHAPWKADTPAIETAATKRTICPSPTHFGPAAKIRGIGA